MKRQTAQEKAREWLMLNDPEAAAFWHNCPEDTDFVAAKEDNLRDFGPEDE